MTAPFPELTPDEQGKRELLMWLRWTERQGDGLGRVQVCLFSPEKDLYASGTGAPQWRYVIETANWTSLEHQIRRKLIDEGLKIEQYCEDRPHEDLKRRYFCLMYTHASPPATVEIEEASGTGATPSEAFLSAAVQTVRKLKEGR